MLREREREEEEKARGKNDIFHHIPLSSQAGNDYFNGRGAF